MKTKMKTTLLLLLFFIAHADASAQEFKLKCSGEQVEAQVGENVTLNCKSETQRDLTKEIISWKFNSTIFLNFKDGKMSSHQVEQFKGRVHRVSGWKVSEGKLSVEISSVNENDTGVYTCSVFNGPNCTVTLTVDKGAREDKQTRDDSNNGAIIAIVVVVLVLVAVIAGLIYRKRKSLLSCIGRGGERAQRGPPQVNQEDIQMQPLNPK